MMDSTRSPQESNAVDIFDLKQNKAAIIRLSCIASGMAALKLTAKYNLDTQTTLKLIASAAFSDEQSRRTLTEYKNEDSVVWLTVCCLRWEDTYTRILKKHNFIP